MTRLSILLPAAAAVGVAEFAIGIYQVIWLSANKSVALAATTMATDDVYPALANLESSAHMSVIAGGVATLLLVGRFLVRKAVPFARLVLWILWSAALLGTLLLVGDSSIGLTAYWFDDDDARRALVNDLLIAPGRWTLLLVAEGLMLVVLACIVAPLASEDTREFLKIRKEPASDSDWDTLLTLQRNRQDPGNVRQ